jgi:hypothetical protein
MYDLLTAKEDDTAAEQGWCLEYVYDTDAQRWVVEILPKEFTPGASARTMALMVIQQARMGNVLSQRALSLVMRGAKVTSKRKK